MPPGMGRPGFYYRGYTITYQSACDRQKKTYWATSEVSRDIPSPQLSCVARNSLLDIASSRTKTGKRRLHYFSYQASRLEETLDTSSWISTLAGWSRAHDEQSQRNTNQDLG